MRHAKEISLNLNEEIRIYVRKRLSEFSTENPNSKFKIVCWIVELTTDISKEIYDYLAKNECPSILKTGGEIIGKDRTTFFRYSKNESL